MERLAEVVRTRGVAFSRWMASTGASMRESASRLMVTPRTLYRWRGGWSGDRPDVPKRGRPAVIPSLSVRRSVVAVLATFGPELSVSMLQWLFPDVSRAALDHLRRRYRTLSRLRDRALIHVLKWHRAGAVWAADFCHVPHPVDGQYPRILNVRDLASGMQLASLPVLDETADTALKILQSLVRWLGCPLVLKVDNGSAFISHEVRSWAADHGIRILYSPPALPEYNGAVEAGTGSIKTRAWHHAARHDRASEWTCDDVEAARLEANETGRPQGRDGPTPDQAWAAREPIVQAERETFERVYRAHERKEREARIVPEGVVFQRQEQAEIDRAALARTLVELGYFSIRRRRITPPRKRKTRDKIS